MEDRWCGTVLAFHRLSQTRPSTLLVTAPSRKVTVPDVSYQPRLSHPPPPCLVDVVHVAPDGNSVSLSIIISYAQRGFSF